MDAIQKLLGQIGRKLSALALSQRIAILLGAALVAVSLFWLTSWAATPDMTPLLPQTLSNEELAAITSGLDTMSVSYRVDGSRVLVPTGQNRTALLAQLQQMEKMPTDTSVSFDALVKDPNPWISQEETDRRWTVAVRNELESILRQFNGVREARVMLNMNARPRGFSRNEAPASASVTLVMKSGEVVSRKLALAAARLVSGAVRGLPIQNVQVLDAQGVAAIEWDSEEAGGSGALERQRREYERQITQKIVGQLAFDPKVRVNVQVEVDYTERATKSSTPTTPVEISEQRSTEESTRVRSAAQPGVQPNTAVAAGGAPGSGDRSETSTSTVERLAGTTYKEDRTPSGQLREAFAAINVSYSYLESVFKRRSGADQVPTPQQIEEIFESEKARIVSQVTTFVKPQKPEQVRVDWYYDTPDALEPVQAGGFDSALNLVQTYGPQAGLGLLALLSLGMMLRLARGKDGGEAFGLELGLPKDAIEAARRAASDVAAAADLGAEVSRSGSRVRRVTRGGGESAAAIVEEDIGQAAITEGVLEAREIDEKTVQINKMVQQVQQMVNADEAAIGALLEQWVEKG